MYFYIIPWVFEIYIFFTYIFFTYSFTFFTFIFFCMHIHIFPHLHIFIHFCFFLYFLFFCNLYEWLCIAAHTIVDMSDYVLLCALHVSVLVYCPTYCGGCLVRGRGCLLNGQHRIPWARVYRVDLLWNIIEFHHINVLMCVCVCVCVGGWVGAWVDGCVCVGVCVHSHMCIYIYINIFSLVIEWFAECHCRHADECIN